MRVGEFDRLKKPYNLERERRSPGRNPEREFSAAVIFPGRAHKVVPDYMGGISVYPRGLRHAAVHLFFRARLPGHRARPDRAFHLVLLAPLRPALGLALSPHEARRDDQPQL